MVCQPRYLNSAGIHAREIPGIESLAQAYPAHWLLYTSLQHYPRSEAPIEIDAMVAMEDRVLLLEIKDWNGVLTTNGDQWVLNGRPRGRSPVDGVGLKARKIKTFLSSAVPGFSRYFVDSRVVLTGSADKSALSASERKQVWTLQEAASIANPSARATLLDPVTFHLKKPYAFQADLDRLTRNPRLWGPLETVWDGYRVVEENVTVHPREIWREHRAERVRDPRFKALLRVWSFDRLPPGLNSAENRRFIADRETRTVGLLKEAGSSLLQQNGLLLPIGEDKDEILTQHFELRELPTGWTTLDRYLERTREDAVPADRTVTATTLIKAVAELHAHKVAHRDLGPRSVWANSPTQVALSGLMASQVPDERSLDDWCAVLRGYGPDAPEDAPAGATVTGRQRDVYALGRLALSILSGSEPSAGSSPNGGGLAPGFADLEPWLEQALSPDPVVRFVDATAMLDEFTAVVDRAEGDAVDQTVLDRAESGDVPFVTWPMLRPLAQSARRHVYVALETATGREVVVKIWLGLRRGITAAADLAMVRLFDGVSRLKVDQLPGLPSFRAAALSPVGPYVVYDHVEGRPFDEVDALDAEAALGVAERLLHCIDTLHALDCTHGDIAERNMLLTVGGDVCLLDLFDLSAVGDGRVRTPSLCPEGWERLTEKQIDRYAGLRLAQDALARTRDERLADAVAALGSELARPAIETLEPALGALRDAASRVRGPQPPSFRLAKPGVPTDFFRSDNGFYYLRVSWVTSGVLQYSLAGVERELSFVVRAEGNSWSFATLSYASLTHASQRGLRLELLVDIVDEPENEGFTVLLAHLRAALEPPLPTETPAEDESASHLAPDGAVVAAGKGVGRGGLPRHLDLRRFWQKLVDLEEAFQPEVEILKEVGARGASAAYAYERVGGDFDFDAESTVEVRLTTGRKVGELDLEQSDEKILVVQYSDRRLVTGDRVHLVDRRAQASLDRRRKAVERIVDNDAAIADLLSYFSPDQTVAGSDTGAAIDDADLEHYGLNAGQSAAFRHLLSHGPVGLLQGPPGTGKTRFIAAFVHWLVTRAGARKILIASQSHEAVNNAIEALVDLFKRFGGRPSLLRIGSKGITEKIRPYHTTALRERYQVRFDAAFKHRIGGLAAAIGLRRAFVNDAVEIDRQLGAPLRRLEALAKFASQDKEATVAVEERRRNDAAVRAAVSAFAGAGRGVLGREADASRPSEELDAAFDALLASHPGTTPADVARVRQIIALSREWSASLASSHRNFEEFLAKTRTIVTATCVGVGQTKIRIDAKAYDWVIVDEAARCTPGELAVPIQVGRRVLLVGDHLQLMPMIERPLLAALAESMPDADPADLARSDFERAYTSSFGEANGQILTEQYRMAPEICDLVSEVFYEPHHVRLTTSPVRTPDRLFATPLPGALAKPIVWIDTSHDQMHVEQEAERKGHSFWNHAEVEAVLKLLERLAEQEDLVAGLSAAAAETPIGVICMYSAQKAKLEQAFARRAWEAQFRRLVRVDTVDSYQGKENAVVVVSLVRCNDRKVAGHVRSPNRCNVALSRAKEKLFIVGARRMWADQPSRAPMRRVVEHLQGRPSSAAFVRSEDF